ncbi:MAG: AEC family transporter [Nitrospirae bacterium]|nr:AEC family transporter [Nitrospirota bacterium]
MSFALIIIAGIAFRLLKVGGLSSVDVRNVINVLVLNVFLPALSIKIFYGSVVDVETILVPLTAVAVSGAALATAFLAYWALGKAFGRVLHLNQSQKGALIIGAAFGNTTYLGLPVIVEVFGQKAAKYVLYYDLMAATPLIWIVGVQIANLYGGKKGISLNESAKTLLSLPPIWGIVIGMALQFFHVPLPAFVLKAIQLLGDLVVPLMIFSIGLALRVPRVGHAYVAVPAVVVKLLLCPLAAFFCAKWMGIGGVALGSCVIEGATPTMVLSLLIAARFNLDVPLSAFLILVTTALSFFTLPAAIYLAGRFA